MTRLTVQGALTALLLAAALPVSAQYSDETPQPYQSGEAFSLELGIGTYSPDPGPLVDTGSGPESLFDAAYPGDNGPMLDLEFTGLIYRIPYVGLIGAAVRTGWAKYSGRACAETSPGSGVFDCTSDDKSKFTLWPVSLYALLRIDVLVRRFDVPLIFIPKLGVDFLIYNAKSAGASTGSGASIGFRWGMEVALQLDFINPRRGNALDEDWGINHTYLFFEIYGSQAGGSVPLGAPWAWRTGLGITF